MFHNGFEYNSKVPEFRMFVIYSIDHCKSSTMLRHSVWTVSSVRWGWMSQAGQVLAEEPQQSAHHPCLVTTWYFLDWCPLVTGTPDCIPGRQIYSRTSPRVWHGPVIKETQLDFALTNNWYISFYIDILFFIYKSLYIS